MLLFDKRGTCLQKFIRRKKTIKPKVQVNDLVRIADLKKTFLKVDTINWSYRIYKITEITKDTIPSYRIESLQERYNEALMKKTELSLKENKDVMKKLNIT